MMNRCYAPTNKDYPTIGGKGIKVCLPWHNYDNFLADLGEKPENSILARYVTTGDFKPDNCFWKQKVHSRSNDLYTIWKSMKRRTGVYRTTQTGVHRKRDIDVCPDWQDNFEQFAKDVGARPSSKHQLDRIDNDLGYWPDNVRWVLPKENANNRCDNVVIEIDGVRKTLQEWIEYHGVDPKQARNKWAVLFINQGDRKIKPCQQIDLVTGEVIAEYDSTKHASEATGVGRGAISKCLSGGNASAGGFKWKYTE